MEIEMDSPAKDDPAELIYVFVKQRFPLATSKGLTSESSLLESGIVDSLGVLDLVGFIEEQFGIEVQDDDLVPEHFDSIDALTRFVQGRR
jgi:acyl carrier protein